MTGPLYTIKTWFWSLPMCISFKMRMPKRDANCHSHFHYLNVNLFRCFVSFSGNPYLILHCNSVSVLQPKECTINRTSFKMTIHLHQVWHTKNGSHFMIPGRRLVPKLIPLHAKKVSSVPLNHDGKWRRLNIIDLNDVDPQISCLCEGMTCHAIKLVDLAASNVGLTNKAPNASHLICAFRSGKAQGVAQALPGRAAPVLAPLEALSTSLPGSIANDLCALWSASRKPSLAAAASKQEGSGLDPVAGDHARTKSRGHWNILWCPSDIVSMPGTSAALDCSHVSFKYMAFRQVWLAVTMVRCQSWGLPKSAKVFHQNLR